jgi:hypothetical protein
MIGISGLPNGSARQPLAKRELDTAVSFATSRTIYTPIIARMTDLAMKLKAT